MNKSRLTATLILSHLRQKQLQHLPHETEPTQGMSVNFTDGPQETRPAVHPEVLQEFFHDHVEQRPFAPVERVLQQGRRFRRFFLRGPFPPAVAEHGGHVVHQHATRGSADGARQDGG